jgi:hypothetical protein
MMQKAARLIAFVKLIAAHATIARPHYVQPAATTRKTRKFAHQVRRGGFVRHRRGIMKKIFTSIVDFLKNAWLPLFTTPAAGIFGYTTFDKLNKDWYHFMLFLFLVAISAYGLHRWKKKK